MFAREIGLALALVMSSACVVTPALAASDEKAAVRQCKKELGIHGTKKPLNATLLQECVNKKLGK